jgi:hypothetical protein
MDLFVKNRVLEGQRWRDEKERVAFKAPCAQINGQNGVIEIGFCRIKVGM